ncbi:MAG: hypothetical protein H0V84_07640, partial [Actinobacteria bacterium]|nr:hypothetical protein [Actinomycetota bacterium]
MLFALMLASGGGASATASDPARLVKWHLIGNIGLGMTATRIEYSYGSPVKRYADKGLDFRIYRGRGRIGAAYDRGGRVVWVSSESGAYRAPNGFGVGSAIPLGQCHRVKGSCVYRWNGFTLRQGEGGTYVWLGQFRRLGETVKVRLEMTRNRVASIALYVERPHVCYPFYV